MPQFSMKFHEVNPITDQQKVKYFLKYRKYNGHAAFWDGGVSRGKDCNAVPWAKATDGLATGLWTIGRDGLPHPTYAPKYWLDSLPLGIPIQGELWYNDDSAIITSITRKKTVDPIGYERWKQIRFVVYNIRPYELLNGFKFFGLQDSPYFKAMKHLDVRRELDYIRSDYIYHPEEIKDSFNNAMILARDKKWEGLVVIDPESKYELKCVRHCLKWKQCYDHEVTIVNYTKGNGKYANKLGSFQYSLTWSERVESMFGGKARFVNKTITGNVGMGLEDYEREWDYVKEHYPLGLAMDIKFNGVTHKGVPIHPRLSKD